MNNPIYEHNEIQAISNSKVMTLAQAKRLRADLTQREKFITLLSHDLKTPVATIKMALEFMLADKEDRSATFDLLTVIKRNLQLIESRVDSLLDVKRITSGYRLPLILDDCNLGDVITDVICDQEIVHKRRFRLLALCEAKGRWDCDVLRRVIENLIINAIKHGKDDGLITVTVWQDSSHVTFEIHNEGEPIPATEQVAIFQPFYRTPHAERRRSQGWGLGLAFVRGAIIAHGGEVALRSTFASGTTFIVTLPKRCVQQ